MVAYLLLLFAKKKYERNGSATNPSTNVSPLLHFPLLLVLQGSCSETNSISHNISSSDCVHFNFFAFWAIFKKILSHFTFK